MRRRAKQYLLFLVIVLLGGSVIRLSSALAGETPDTQQEQGAEGMGAIARNVQATFRFLSFGVAAQPVNSTQNPSDNFLKMPRYVGNIEARPDFRLTYGNLELGIKPRARFDYSAWEDGSLKGRSASDDDVWVNEYIARLKVRENLFVSYGRENLQWGPSFLFSPSNPFFQDNGRRNPYLEVPGMDFGRAVWIPGGTWTFSFISNTGEGVNKRTGPGAFLASVPPPPFERTYTLKADYTGREQYASLILSRRQDAENILGFYGGWTATDAILLYGEGSVSQGSRGLYPEQDRSPLGGSMEALHAHDSTLYPVLLVGSSYTFESKGTLSIEYAHYSPGYNKSEAETYYDLRRKGAQAFTAGGMLSGLGQQTLGQTAVTNLRFLRRNYAMLQYSQPGIKDRIDLSFRWTQNIDDGSGQFTAVASYQLGGHIELFSVGTAMAGGKNTEFGSILDYQLLLGLQYTF